MYDSDSQLRTTKYRQTTVSGTRVPVRLPVSPRRLQGGFPVEEARRRLMRLCHGHLAIMRVLAGWIIRIPEFETKLELGHHIYLLADGARFLRERARELRVPLSTIDGPPDRDVRILGEELLYAKDASELLAGTHLVATRSLLDQLRNYLDRTDRLLDLPTVRIMERIQNDLESMVGWGGAAVEAYRDSGTTVDPEPWQAHCRALAEILGYPVGNGSNGPRPPLRQETEPPFRRQVGCERDARFTTFHHTRDYRTADDLAQGMNEYEAERLHLIRVQRDEIDAIETFANVLFDLGPAEFDLKMDLARFIWDEARHAEIGHQALERLGYDPFRVPCDIIGIKVRSPLAPEVAFAQISVFGELNIVGPMRQLAKRAYERGDRETGVTFDYIHSDEIIHLRRGRRWLRKLSGDGDLSSLQERARIQAIRRLVEEGVIGEDYAMDLSPSRISELLGGGG